MKLTPLHRRKSGFVTLYVLFTSLTLIPVVGLAIDFSVLYNVKARLQTAVDAGCIAAGYTLQRTTNMTDPIQLAAIRSTAQSFFNANYPTRYWGSTQASYTATPATGPNNTRTITIQASEYVPLLFLRVLGLSQSTVAADATVTVRFLTMMIVVDRSGSVQRAGNDTTVKNALTQFIGTAGTSPFVDGRDVIGMGSFGGAWYSDFDPVTSFRSSSPNITTAINGLYFGNSATNTAEGLHQAYTKLQGLNQTGALNVIVLLTDGRPSAFTATYTSSMYAATSPCTTKTTKTGFVTATVGSSWPPLPPTTQGGAQGTRNPYAFGIFPNIFVPPLDFSYGDANAWVPNSNGCHYLVDGTSIKGTDMYMDFPNFPITDTYGNSTQNPVFTGGGTSLSSPQAVRFASINAADNQATTIRRDTTIRPVLFVIGLVEPPTEELLDPDWLARVANDPNYKDSFGNSVFQSGQTAGMYYNVTGSGLAAAFQDIASQILRLSQ